MISGIDLTTFSTWATHLEEKEPASMCLPSEIDLFSSTPLAMANSFGKGLTSATYPIQISSASMSSAMSYHLQIAWNSYSRERVAKTTSTFRTQRQKIPSNSDRNSRKRIFQSIPTYSLCSIITYTLHLWCLESLELTSGTVLFLRL